MSANNNTTSLNMGGNDEYLGGTRQMSDSAASMISSSISRATYRESILKDKNMADFRDSVYGMVSAWTKEDKLAIITEYGDASYLDKYGKRANDDNVLNDVCTESIITHLNPADLRQLYADIVSKRNRLLRTIRTTESKMKPKRALSTANFGEKNEDLENAKNANQYIKARKEAYKDYKVPKYIERMYSTLRRELQDVLLNCYDKIELTGIALSMDISLDGNPDQKKLIRMIINKTCLYVDLIIGKSKQQYAGAIVDPRPYKDLLKMTSYSYVTGEPGLDPNAWRAAKDAARQAKKAIRERSKMQGLNRRYARNSKYFREISGGIKAGSLHSMASQIKKEDTGVLANLEIGELLELAGRYGIDPTALRNRNISILKAKIYEAMAYEGKRIAKLSKREDRAKRMGYYSRNLSDKLAAHRDLGKYIKQSSNNSEATALPGTPIVKFASNGALITKNVTSAVPVYVIGKGKTGDSRGAKTSMGKGFNIGTDDSIDIDIININQLSADEVNLYKNIMTAEDYSSNKINKQNISLDIVRKELIKKYNVRKTTLNKIDLLQDGETKRQYYCFIYATVKEYKNLRSYLKNNFNIYLSNKQIYDDNIKIKKNIKTILGIPLLPGKIIGKAAFITIKGVLGIVTLRNAKTNLKDPSQLTDKDRDLYNNLKNNQSMRDFKAGLLKPAGKYDPEKFDNLMALLDTIQAPNSVKLNFMRALYARSKGWKAIESVFLNYDLQNYYYNDESVKICDAYKELTKNIGGGLSKTFHSIGNLFSSRKGKKLKITDRLIQGDNYYDNAIGNTDQSVNNDWGNIPQISFNILSGSKEDVVGILSSQNVIPVYVVNSLVDFKRKKEAETKATEGAENNQSNENSIVKNIIEGQAPGSITESQNNNGQNSGSSFNGINRTNGSTGNQSNNTTNNTNTSSDKKNDGEPESQEDYNRKLAKKYNKAFGDGQQLMHPESLAVYYDPSNETHIEHIKKINSEFNRSEMEGTFKTKSGKDAFKATAPIVKYCLKEDYEIAYRNTPPSAKVAKRREQAILKAKKDVTALERKEKIKAKIEKTKASVIKSGKETVEKIKEKFKATKLGGKMEGLKKKMAEQQAKLLGKKEARKTKKREKAEAKAKRIEEANDLNTVMDEPTVVEEPESSDPVTNLLGRIQNILEGRPDNQPEIAKSIFGPPPTDSEKEPKTLPARDSSGRFVNADGTNSYSNKKPEGQEEKEITLPEIQGKVIEAKTIISSGAKRTGKIDKLFSAPATPVFITNKFADGNKLITAISNISDSISGNFADLMLGLSTMVIGAPMGVGVANFPLMTGTAVGTQVLNAAVRAGKTAGKQILTQFDGASTGGVVKAASGGTISKSIFNRNISNTKNYNTSSVLIPKFASGGGLTNSVITGDALGNDIFKGGAKPELVSAASDISVIPLNKTGTESKQKISRMTSQERRQALATSLSSHIIKCTYSLPNGAEDVSNIGEAIKVYNIKPGITDEIDFGGTKTTMANMITAIYQQLVLGNQLATSETQLLTAIASNGTNSKQKISNNVVTTTDTFPTSMNNILGGM